MSKEIFGQDDMNLFLCEDKDLKAMAIRNSIIPRLLDVVKECVSEIRRVYDVDALDVSTLCWSPHSAESRGKGYKCDFNAALAGICAKHAKSRPLHIFNLQLVSAHRGLGVWLRIAKCALEDDIAKAITAFIAQHEVEVLSLVALVAGQINLLDGEKKCWVLDWFPLSKSINTLALHRRSELLVWSNRYTYPITEVHKDSLVLKFVLLYPLYWAITEIGEGREPLAFGEMVKRAFQLRKEKETELGKRGDHRQDEAVDLAHVEVLAESKTKVPIGRRWQVFERDGWRCVSCGRGAEDGAILEVDHILPRSRGGADSLDNYQTLCRECNIGKSNKSQANLRAKTYMRRKEI